MSSTAAAADDRERQALRQALEPLLDRVRDARILGARDDRRQGAVEVECEQRTRRHDGGQCGLALGREQVLHVSRSGGASRAPRCAGAGAPRPASVSMCPAQRNTLFSRTVMRRLAMRSRCSAIGIVAARCSASAVSSTWYGLTISASVISRAAPAKRLSTSVLCSSSRTATNSLLTRFMPSCRLVITQMSAARYSSATSRWLCCSASRYTGW